MVRDAQELIQNTQNTKYKIYRKNAKLNILRKMASISY